MAPRILLHDNPAQPASCLASLVAYAYQIERTELARTFESLEAMVGWLRLQPVKLDAGEAPQLSGCGPKQRARIWPLDGMNCWEATAHFLGVAIALEVPAVVHVFDVTIGNTRHVFPALQDTLEQRGPVPVELQTALLKDLRAQAWWNDVADVAHQAGSSVLTAYGGGALVPYVEKAWQQAPREYGLTKYKDTPPDTPVDVKGSAIRALPELPQRFASIPLGDDEKRLLNNPTVQSLPSKTCRSAGQQTEGEPVMNAMMLALAGGALDPELLSTFSKMEHEKRRKMESLVKAFGKNVSTGYRYLKGTPKIVNAAGAELSTEDPRYTGILLKYKDEQDIKYAALENLINGFTEAMLEFIKPSAMEMELMARLMGNKGKKPDARFTAGAARFGA